MNLKYLTISLVILFTSILNISSIQENKTSLLCSGKWYMSSMELEDTKVPIPDEERKKMWMIFYKDGKHEVSAGSQIKKGLWEFSENKDSIVFTIENGEIKSMKLIALKKKELHLTFLDNGKEITAYLDQEK